VRKSFLSGSEFPASIAGRTGYHVVAPDQRGYGQTDRHEAIEDLYDHELQGDHTNDLQEGAQRLQVLMKQVPDLTVDVRDVIAEGDKVVVRAVWSGTDAVSQKKVEFHGFVQWRIVDSKFAERWATVTPIEEIPEGTNVW
jgi:predicted ester cyclase